MRLEIGERDELECPHMGGAQADARRAAGRQGFSPACRADAPVIAGLESGKSGFRHGCAEIVAACPAEIQECLRHPGAHRMHAGILRPGFTAPVAGETGQRSLGTAFQRFSQYVFLFDGTHVRAWPWSRRVRMELIIFLHDIIYLDELNDNN